MAGIVGAHDLSASDRDRAVQEGQAIYAKFGDAAAKPRYEFQLRVGKREGRHVEQDLGPVSFVPLLPGVL